jgi:tRNA nucleotidyltransferase (CCA-adding enzyme)
MYILYEKKIFFNFNFLKQILNKKFMLMGLAKISLINKGVDIRFAYLCQFLSIHQMYSYSSQTFFDQHSASIINNLCKRFNVPSHIRDLAVLNTGFCFFLSTINCQSSKNIIKLFLKIDAWRKPERVKKLELLNNFNFLNQSQSSYFLKKCFSVVQNISIELILKKGFRGYAIKNELMRLRIKKLELWRLKNIKFFFEI